MGLLKRIIHGKEEQVHFERDSRGRVTDVQRSGDVDSVTVDFNGQTHTRGATPVSDRLMAQRPRKPSIREKAGKVARRVDQAVVNYNRRQTSRPSQGRLYGTSYSTRQNYNPFGSMFDTGIGYRKPPRGKAHKPKYTIVGGKAYPIAGTGSKKKRPSGRKTTAGFDMMDNWGFFK